MIKFEMTEGGQRLVGYYEKVGAKLWVHVNGRSFIYEDEAKQKRNKSHASLGSANEIAAPMPGKITNIKLKSGDKVKKGDIVIIMEAMKMEYSLKSPRETEISEIKCKVGDQVVLGQALAVLKEG